MRKKTMVSHACAETAGDPAQDHSKGECSPTENEQRGDSADVYSDHDEGGNPNNGLSEGSVAFDKRLQSHIFSPVPWIRGPLEPSRELTLLEMFSSCEVCPLKDCQHWRHTIRPTNQ
jgi:hypothetical protein